MDKFTKIVATLGPKSDSIKIISSLKKAGMDVCRLNFSHGNYEYFTKLISNIRDVDPNLGILLDTKGPEIRSGALEEDLLLEGGEKLFFTNKKLKLNSKNIILNYKNLMELKIGNIILIDDGLIETRVTQIYKDCIEVEVLNGGVLGSNKTVSIQGHDVNINFLSKKDKEDLIFGLENNVDFIAASFVRTREDVVELKKFLIKNSSKDKILPLIISKIEHPKAVKNIDEIIEESDGIMVARGDLGVEVPLELVPKYQQQIITKCNEVGKPVIVATQMLESMKDNPRPTRAEASDVAHAILHGADAVMLSGETASGKYPEKSVQTMSNIAKTYEQEVIVKLEDEYLAPHEESNNSISKYITGAAADAAKKLGARAIIVPTESGYSARQISRFRPHIPIYALTQNSTITRQLQLTRGVFSFCEDFNVKTVDELINFSVLKTFENGLISNNDRVIITSGHILQEPGHTNILQIFRVKHILDRCGK